MQILKPKYDFKEVELGRYEKWRQAGYFKSGKKDLKPYTIVIPPPNITGILHLGHAWDNTLQDIVIRRKRMQGYDALYLPGMDHAGIATQARVDEKLKKEGKSRYEIGREAFLKEAWKWKEDHADIIHQQWQALGLSLDYDKERFTLDKGLNRAVNKVFITLYNEGLIYRDYKIINWDPKAKTALSNIEVEHVEKTSKLYYIKYPLVDEDGAIEIATTRPETMFADQALMVHPKDKRYLKYHNKFVYIPGTKTKIPVICDDYVDREFGTGAVKVTPAHDPNDFEVAHRHNLDFALCMNEDATMNALSGKYKGQDRFECRENLCQDLKKLGLLTKILDHVNAIGYSERTGVMVEPRLSLQWFVKMDELAKDALLTKVKFHPKRFLKTYRNWLLNIQDWCISRQVWWGHRIPAWYLNGEVKVQEKSPGPDWVQDEDVLDTWFSSALWPFSTLGWPDQTSDFNHYYPTNLMVTGYDIIFFWVTRMIFQGRHFTKKDPFEACLLHGLIRDREGRKMSKSLGNGVDPIDVINQYGIDALRYFLTTNSAPGADLRFEEEKVESSWNFINKLWNITRFIQMNVDSKLDDTTYSLNTLADKWILSRLNEVIRQADYYYDKFEFGEVSKVLYNFIWDEFASWYLEIAKVQLQDENLKTDTQKILLYVLKAILKMMHPFIPFVTDELYLSISDAETIMLEAWPKPKKTYQVWLKRFNSFSEIVVKIRNLRNEYNVALSKPIDLEIVIADQRLRDLTIEMKDALVKLVNPRKLKITSKLSETRETLLVTTKDALIYVLKADIENLEAQKLELLKQKENLEKELNRSRGMLNNQKFLEKAHPDKVKLEKDKFLKYQAQYEAVIKELKKYE